MKQLSKMEMLMHLDLREFDDDLGDGLHLAGFDGADPHGHLMFNCRLWYGENDERVREAAADDLDSGYWTLVEEWKEDGKTFIRLNLKF